MKTIPVFEAFKARDDLNIYGDNALLLFMLELRYDIDDIHAVAEDALTDGFDDKKCDLVYVDVENRYAIIGQGYLSRNFDKKSAPSGKAADLNTAVSWLLSVDLNNLPETIKSAARQLRDALSSGNINTLELWYSHNLPESQNVANELAAVERTTRDIIRSSYPNSNCNEIRSSEIGVITLEEWYKAISTPILVEDSFTIQIPGGYGLQTDDWRAYATALPAKWLYEIYNKYGEKLFSANPRGYLGSRRSDKNINNGIKQSAREQADKFWAFNNGVTALVNKFKVIGRSNKKIRIDGVSIVNGAQTTGAIGSLKVAPSSGAMVPARFIMCSNRSIVQEIVEYNNSQNKMVPSDFRSGDTIQKRLRKEFDQYPFPIMYTGGRRGGAEDKIRRNPNIIPSDTVAQSLAAFHGRPGEAYNRKSQIWKSQKLYEQFFNEHTHAEHIIFVYSLYRAISSVKIDLMNKSRAGKVLTEDEKNTLSFLRLRGAIYLLMAAIGSCLETILDRPIPSKFLLRYKTHSNLESCQDNWQPIVDICLSFNDSLRNPLEGGLKRVKDIEDAISQFSMYVRGTRKPNKTIYQEFSDKVFVRSWFN